jgi:hypothetical protein
MHDQPPSTPPRQSGAERAAIAWLGGKMSRTPLEIRQFLRANRGPDIQHVYALDTRRSNEETLYLEHWRAGIARTIPTRFVETVTPLGVFLDSNPLKPLVSIDFNHPESQEVQGVLSFDDPHVRSVTLIPFPSPPGGSVDNVQAVEFFAAVTSQINCLFSQLQPEPPHRPLQRMAALYKNDYFFYYDLLGSFSEASPSGKFDLDFYDYHYVMAAFTRPRGSSANWQPSPVSNITVKNDRFVFTYIDCIVDGGVTGGEIKITSSIEVIFDS